MAEQEFVSVEDKEWEVVAESEEGKVKQKIIYDDGFDPDKQEGAYVRLLDVTPGFENEEGLSHDFYEVVYVLEGGQYNKETGEVYTKGMVASFEPGEKHGPFKVPTGIKSLEFRYYK